MRPDCRVAADTSAVTSQNGNIATAFGSAPTYLELAELGGRHDTGGTATDSITEKLILTVDPTLMPAAQDLIVGLYNPTVLGTGSATFNVSVDGTSAVSQNFSTLSAASSYFTNHAVDLGSVASFAAAGPITVGITLQESTATGSGLFAGLLIGTSHV